MKAFVTGIDGFAGRHLTRRLLEAQVEVYGTSRPELDGASPRESDQARRFGVDILNSEEITKLLDEIRPDWVFHLAAVSSPAGSIQDPLSTFQTNVRGTWELLDALRSLGLAARVLVVSSGNVYGRTTDRAQAFDEDAPFNPQNPYAASKAASELIAAAYGRAYGAEIIRVRPFNHTGPGQRKGFLCPDIASQIAQAEAGSGPASIVTGDLSARLDLSDVRDIVNGYLLAMERGKPGRVYNLCSGTIVSAREVAEKLLSMSHLPLTLSSPAGADRAENQPTLAAHNSRASRELGWRAHIPLEQTLSDTLEYWRQALPSRQATTRNAM